MALTGVPFAGETIEVTIRAARTSGGRVVRDGSAEVRFWPPGVGVGDPPAYIIPALWDPAVRGFAVYADTEGWVPGTWTYQGTVTTDTETGPVTGKTEYTALPLR